MKKKLILCSGIRVIALILQDHGLFIVELLVAFKIE